MPETKQEVKHTATPWEYQEESDAYTHIIRGPNDRFIVQFSQDTSGRPEADARFIVLAVNAFDQMREALELAREIAANYGWPKSRLGREREVFEAIEAAIRAAGGKE